MMTGRCSSELRFGEARWRLEGLWFLRRGLRFGSRPVAWELLSAYRGASRGVYDWIHRAVDNRWSEMWVFENVPVDWGFGS